MGCPGPRQKQRRAPVAADAGLAIDLHLKSQAGPAAAARAADPSTTIWSSVLPFGSLNFGPTEAPP